MGKKRNKNHTHYQPVDNSVGNSECVNGDANTEGVNTLTAIEKNLGKWPNSQGDTPLNDVHHAALQNIRVFVETLVKRLQQDVDNLWVNTHHFSDIKEQNVTPHHMKYIWGEKESVTSSLVKLTGLLTKLIAMERDIAQDALSEEANTEHATFTEADKALIEKYFTTKWKVKSDE